MRPRLTCVSLILALCCGVASPVFAREVTISRIDPSTVREPTEALAPSATCVVGNFVNPAYWAISNFVTAPESYAVSFRPSDSSCATCPLGYQVSTVRILLQTSAAETIVMSVGLSSATFPSGPSCAQPGPQECLDGPYQVNIPSAGVWNIALPLDCGCAFKDYDYALTVRFESITGPTPSLVTDNFPGPCTSWNDYGSGWVDLVSTAGFPGNLKIFADADCCEMPVGADEETMGSIKGRFKN